MGSAANTQRNPPPDDGRTAEAAYHQDLTVEALKSAGFSAGATDTLVGEVIEDAQKDKEWSPQNGESPAKTYRYELHCVRKEKESSAVAFERTAAFIWQRREDCKVAATSGKMEEALKALGEAMYAIQALIANSNWLELSGVERTSVRFILLRREVPVPANLKIAAMAANGGSPKGDPFGIDEHNGCRKDIPGWEDRRRASLSALVLFLDSVKVDLGSLWVKVSGFEASGRISGELSAYAHSKGLDDAAIASIVVGPDETATITNPYETAITVTDSVTGVVTNVEAYGSLALTAKQERMLVGAPLVGTTIIAVKHVDRRTRQEETAVGIVTLGGESKEEIPIYGSATPLMVVDGNAPAGATIELRVTDDKEKTTAVPAQSLLIVTTADHRVRQTICRFVSINVSVSIIRSTTLVLIDTTGAEIATKTMTVRDASLGLKLSPVSGSPGQPATVTIDGAIFRIALGMDRPLMVASDLVYRIDYSRSGGANGPRIVPFPEAGSVQFEVARGSIPGAFKLIVIPVRRTALFSETVCGGGSVTAKSRAVFLSPHSRASLPGCPYCNASPMRLGAARPGRCPGETHSAASGMVYVPAHDWGKARTCAICRG